MTCRVLTFSSGFPGPLLAGRSPERTIEAALETDLLPGFVQPDAESFEALHEARDVLFFSRAAITPPLPPGSVAAAGM